LALNHQRQNISASFILTIFNNIANTKIRRKRATHEKFTQWLHFTTKSLLQAGEISHSVADLPDHLAQADCFYRLGRKEQAITENGRAESPDLSGSMLTKIHPC